MNLWIIFALLSAVFAALVAIFGKIGITGVDPTLATTVRAIIMATFLAIITLLSGKWQTVSTINGKLFFFIALSGIAGALSWLFYFVALKYGPASGVAALDRLSVVFVVIFAALFLAEALTLKVIIGAILITIGALFMVF
jgi:bacterial/archaeal transporter family protein